MNDKVKNIVVVVIFLTFIIGFSAVNIIIPDRDISVSERRELGQLPELSTESILNGRYFSDLEKYLLDQFILRDSFRTLNALGQSCIFQKKDIDGIYVWKDAIFKIEYPLNEFGVERAARIFNSIQERHLDGLNVFYSIIPDRSYFVAEKSGRPFMDYDRLNNILHSRLTSMEYIDIYPLLSISDYYRTDLHWRQEKIIHVAQTLLDGMNVSFSLSDINFELFELYPFLGSYYRQTALPIRPDNLIYLKSPVMNDVIVTNRRGDILPLYDIAQFHESRDSYNIFLSGPQPLLTIENPSNTSGRKLYLFRDSFGSSIAPLLIEAYSKITVIDIRYLSGTQLERQVEFIEDGDVLFLYSTVILNAGETLRS